MKSILNRIKERRTGRIIGLEVAVLMAAAAFFLPGGQDLRWYYLPFAEGCLSCGFVPYFFQPLLAPLGLIPGEVVWPIWTLVSAGTFLWLCTKTGVNPAVLFLTFPFFGQFWLGQVDVVLCFGLYLAFFSKKAVLRGAGYTLLLIKPQVSIMLVVYLLVKENRKELLKVLSIPAVVIVSSLLVFGLDWPVVWVRQAQESIPGHVWKLATEFFWPWGLALLPLPFFFRERKDGAMVSLLVSSLALPFFSVYSYVVFLLLEAPWWVLPVSYVWMLGYPWLGIDSMKFAWVLPLALLVWKLSQRFERSQPIPRKLP